MPLKTGLLHASSISTDCWTVGYPWLLAEKRFAVQEFHHMWRGLNCSPLKGESHTKFVWSVAGYHASHTLLLVVRAEAQLHTSHCHTNALWNGTESVLTESSPRWQLISETSFWSFQMDWRVSITLIRWGFFFCIPLCSIGVLTQKCSQNTELLE